MFAFTLISGTNDSHGEQSRTSRFDKNKRRIQRFRKAQRNL